MLKQELVKLRKLIKQAEKGQTPFSTIYKKLDRIENIVQADSENSEQQISPANYIKPIKGLLDTYQQSLEQLKHLKTRAALSQKQNQPSETPSRIKSQYTSSRPSQRSSSTHTKSIRELDAEIMQLTRQIRNTLR